VLTGCPVHNTAIYLLDENHRPVVSGEVGELYVSGLNLTPGYVRGRDPERFIPNPLTVDPGEWQVTQVEKLFWQNVIPTGL
jgi:non-ribosomal peptide synthetase component F